MKSKSYCRYCDQPIRWVKSSLGQWIPVEEKEENLLPLDSGPVSAVDEKGRIIRGMIKKRASKRTVKVSLPHRNKCWGNMESCKEKAASCG